MRPRRVRTLSAEAAADLAVGAVRLASGSVLVLAAASAVLGLGAVAKRLSAAAMGIKGVLYSEDAFLEDEAWAPSPNEKPN